MLFNSYAFVFAFLPVVLAVFYLAGRTGPVLAAGWLALASVFFYGVWNPAYVPLLLGSVAVNFQTGSAISRAVVGGALRRAGWLTAAGITANLLLLGYYKYANFFLTSLGVDAGNWLANFVLPLGISFFTFTQIAFLADCRKGEVREYRFIHYLLFVTYFPHLIAGPILHHKEMMQQFEAREICRPEHARIAVGLTVFIIGLFKKVVLADGVSVFVPQAFAAAATSAVNFADAWGAALAYTLQLYFDFSGYSDMAVGLSLLFGIRLPVNFYSPYRASSIIEFWRRWHMTLSRFLREYLYIPLGGNRRGPLRRYANVMVTMLLGGLWHGAGWTFVVWGGLHGLYLVCNHAWRALAGRLPIFGFLRGRIWTAVSTLVTFTAVVFAWVFFRAENLSSALGMLAGMLGVNGISMPDFAGSQFYWITLLLGIAWLMPNTVQFMRHVETVLPHGVRERPPLQAVTWSPKVRWALFFAAATLACIVMMRPRSEFLYFQF